MISPTINIGGWTVLALIQPCIWAIKMIILLFFLSFIILSILLTLSVEGKSLLILTLFSLSSLLSSNINGCPDKRQQSVLPCPAEDYRMISGFILLILISSSLGFHMTRHVTPSSLNPSVHNVFLPRLETPHPIISVMVRLT